MSDFNDVDYDSSSSTAIIGAGLIWDDVYQALQPYGVNVVGGRVSGVGVAGFTLGGGTRHAQCMEVFADRVQDTVGSRTSTVSPSIQSLTLSSSFPMAR
jgi:hypothetical protein